MKALLLLLSLCTAGMLHAQESLLDDPSLHLGGGLGSTAVDDVTRTTLQLFAGIDTLREGSFRGGIEVGLMDVSDSPKDLIWVAGVLRRQLSADIHLYGRAGLDLGNQAGLMAGVGIGYFIETNTEVRFNATTRDMGSGVQLNVTWYPARLP